MSIFIKIILLLLKLLLKLARLLSFKRLESFLTKFLKKKFDFPEQTSTIEKTQKLKPGKTTILKTSREMPKREKNEDNDKEDKEAAEPITMSRFIDDDNESNVKPLLISGGVLVAATAGVGIASIVRNKDDKPKDKDLSEVEFEESDTYKKLFAKGFKKATGVEPGTYKPGESRSFLGSVFSGFKRVATPSSGKPKKIISGSEYQKYYTSNRVGQPMDLLGRYTYDKKTQAIGITTEAGTRMRKINEIIIHCTATPEGREVSRQELHEWHTNRGFNGIGYHFIIHIDGTIESARPLYMIGAHCLGHNTNSIGISYVGGTKKESPKQPKDTRTPAQVRQIWNLVLYLLNYFPSATVHGHYEYAAKACPCFNVQKEWKEIQFGSKGKGVQVLTSSTSQTYSTSQFNDDSGYQAGDVEVVVTNND
jgi:N-acetylmuramoyl-L-alanine amidase